MKWAFAFALLALTATAEFLPAQTAKRVKAVADRTICVSRQKVVDGGVTNVVATWRYKGREWTTTNAVRSIVLRPQTNTFVQRLGAAQAAAQAFRDSWLDASNRAAFAEGLCASLSNRVSAAETLYAVATNRAAVAEALYAAKTNAVAAAVAPLQEKRADYVSKRDKAALPTTKAIYQLFIDDIDAILDRLGAD